MKNKSRLESNIIEYLLSTLDNSSGNSEEIDSLWEKYQSPEFCALLENRERQMAYQLKEFLDSIPGGFFICRADGNEEIIYANEAMLRLFNCDTMEEFRAHTGNSFKGIVHPDDLQTVKESIAEQIKSSQYDMDYVEYRIIQKGGKVLWVDDYGHFAHSETAGDIFYVFLGDATEKKSREQEEKEVWLNEKRIKEQQMQSKIDEYNQELKVIHQEHLRRLEMIEGMSIDYESIFFVDLDANRIKPYRVGERFRKQFSDEGEMREFIGFDTDYIRDWVYPDDRKILQDVCTPEFIREKLAEEKSWHLNYRILKDKKTIYKQLRIVNVGNTEYVSQVALGYRNIDEEIIQEIKQKQMMAKALDEANRANSAKNLFLSNMSHDIRTPMNAIVGFTSLVRKYIDDKERVLEYLDMISASSEQLLQLLNDVLEISRIESGKIHVEQSECSLMDIAQQVQTTMLPHAAVKNILLSLDVSHLTHDIVSADQQKLRQILLYLVDNAVKYTKEGGWITIMVMEGSAASDGRTSFHFIVEDNGIGISKQFIKHIFEPFEREKNTTLSGIYGTGLGLTITKDLVDMLGGNIEVSSVVGEGSKFTVTLPFHVYDKKTLSFEESDDISMNFSGPKRILIVDDNEINLEIENEVLKDVGFLVDTATDGSIAVEKVKQSKPGDYDLILMDIQMPVMDGYHAARAIRSMENPILAGIPIIAVSANAFEEDKIKAKESGMNAHLAKPLDTARLYKLIRKVLKNSENIVKVEDMIIRPIKEEEYPLFEDFLYDAIYQPGDSLLPRGIINQPKLAIYIQDFGRPDDHCLVAESNGRVLGAVWTRILSGEVKGYGYIDNRTPEFAISIQKDFRRQGIGRKLMQEMIALLKKEGYERTSLSVNKENYAYWLYQKLGFQVVKVQENDYLMVLEL